MTLYSLIIKMLKINWWTTLKINFCCLSINYAFKLPILCFGKFSIHSLKGNIQIDSNIIKTGMIQIGESSIGIFEKKGKTVLNIKGIVIFKGKCEIGNGSGISVGKDSVLTIGENFKITAKSSIICSGKKNVKIGNNTLFSWDILVINNDFHKIYDVGQLNATSEDILIGDNVWIGCRSTILKGSIIPNNSVIAATSTILGKRGKENCIYTGLPVKILKENIYWEP